MLEKSMGFVDLPFWSVVVPSSLSSDMSNAKRKRRC